MPALDFRAFAAGFATQAQKIEEESAKIGMELLKKAMDDFREEAKDYKPKYEDCLLYTSPSPRDGLLSRMPSSA